MNWQPRKSGALNQTSRTSKKAKKLRPRIVARQLPDGSRPRKLELGISGDIDLRGFLAIDRSVAPGYERLHYTVRIAGDGTQEQYEKMHEVVQRTSPNYYNISNPIELTSELVVA
jgi:hypothetical protein